MVHLYGPVDVVALYVGAHFKRTPTSEGLTIGAPLLEAGGVVGRRALVAYPFSGEQVAYARKVIVSNVAKGLHGDVITFDDQFPSDWRHQLTPAASTLLTP